MIIIFSINELIYIIKTIYTDSDLENYFFKKDIQKKLDKIPFNNFRIFIEKCEKISSSLEKTSELNSLNAFHFDIQKQVIKELSEYILE